MRILFLLRSSIHNRMGGAELQAHYISREFKERGHEVHFAFDSNKNLQIEDDGIIYHFLHDYGNSFCWLNYFSIGNLLNEIDPDIIYHRCRFAYTGIVANYAKKKSIKMVYHIALDNDCWKNKVPINKNYIPNLIKEYGGRYGIKNAYAIIAQSRQQQKWLKKNFNRNSILMPKLFPIPPQPFKKSIPPIVSWIANIKPVKQPEIFIKLAEKCQNLNAQFVYVGRLMKGERQKILIENTRKLSNLEYLGEIPFKKTNELLSESSIFVNTSLYESYPNTYIQAWLRETPVVALHHDPDNLLEKRKIGFQSSNFEQLVKDVRYLIENGNARREMGKRARKYAIETHNIEKIGKKYIKVFENLMER